MMRDTSLQIGADHFLNRPAPDPVNWLAWFVVIGGAIAVGGFLGLLGRINGVI
ncbi:MAG TPA: hypothetical protein VE935_21710 [Burkholderiales bacterium]|jgi:hypothetical protein|nr:hypothetical protein [Burkholderiales bacterium]